MDASAPEPAQGANPKDSSLDRANSKNSQDRSRTSPPSSTMRRTTSPAWTPTPHRSANNAPDSTQSSPRSANPASAQSTRSTPTPQRSNDSVANTNEASTSSTPTQQDSKNPASDAKHSPPKRDSSIACLVSSAPSSKQAKVHWDLSKKPSKKSTTAPALHALPSRPRMSRSARKPATSHRSQAHSTRSNAPAPKPKR